MVLPQLALQQPVHVVQRLLRLSELEVGLDEHHVSECRRIVVAHELDRGVGVEEASGSLLLTARRGLLVLPEELQGTSGARDGLVEEVLAEVEVSQRDERSDELAVVVARRFKKAVRLLDNLTQRAAV